MPRRVLRVEAGIGRSMLPFALVWAMAACGCTSNEEDKAEADAVTEATYKVATDVVLPPKTGEYEVIGKVEGLNKYVVRYDDKVIRGGQPLNAAGMKKLKEWGVKTILSVTADDTLRKYAKEGGFALVEVPFKGGEPISAQTLGTFLRAVRERNGPFYVHCMGGTHRAGALCLAYRTHVDGWDYDKALIEFGRLGGDLKKDHAMVESTRPK